MVSIVEIIPFLVFLLGAAVVESEKDCSITLPKNYRNGRIYTTVFRWKRPLDSYGNSKDCIHHGDVVRLTCPNGFVKEDLTEDSYVFECTNGKLNHSLLYEDLMCRSDFHKNTRVDRAWHLDSNLFHCAGRQQELYEVNVLENGTYKQAYKVCFDKSVMRTKFSFQYPRDEVFIKSNESRKDVWGLDYFGRNALEKVKLSNGYVSKIQRSRITKAFPSRYNKNKPYPYKFNRGHLAPYADFSQTDKKKASCEYINVAPQWNDLNGNTWSSVERITRDLVKNNPADWEIYTGTYGSIPTERGPLYVSPFFNDRGKFIRGFIPVPKLYWKIVHNIFSKNDSRVFVGVNNPELKSPDEFVRGYMVCKPKLLQKGTFFMGSEFKGFAYECDLDEFVDRLAKDENLIRA